jgi:hypothetical protein
VVIQCNEDFERILVRGAARVIARLGVENGHAAKGCRVRRDLLGAWRMTRRTTRLSVIEVVTTGLPAALPVGAAIRCPLSRCG